MLFMYPFISNSQIGYLIKLDDYETSLQTADLLWWKQSYFRDRSLQNFILLMKSKWRFRNDGHNAIYKTIRFELED